MPASIPRRDYILLPLVSIATAALLVAGAEIAARCIWVERDANPCDYVDANGLSRHKANCIGYSKTVEGPWVRYQYNECGYRSAESCGSKPAGTKRFVILGSSAAHGVYVREEDTCWRRIAPQLSRLTGARVEFQNMGEIGMPLANLYRVVPEVVGLRPDGVFLLVVPYDLVRLETETHPAHAAPPSPFWSTVRAHYRSSRAVLVAQHFALRNEKFALDAYRAVGPADDVSRVSAFPALDGRYENLAEMLEQVSRPLRERGVPLFLVGAPNRVQALLESQRSPVEGFDPGDFSRRLASIAARSGAEYIDTVSAFRSIPHADRLFYADGHPAGDAHAVIAAAVFRYFQARDANALAGGAVAERR